MSPVIATYVISALFICGGLLALWVAVTNADWFFRSADVRMLIGRLSRPAARILYAAIGLAILAMSGYLLSTIQVST